MATNNDAFIELKNLYSIYNQNNENYFVANKDINYNFQPNQIYFIIGNSGSGKSTLIHHFNGLKATKYGSVKINQREIGTDLNINGFYLGSPKLETLDLAIKKKIQFKLSQKHGLKVYILAFNQSCDRNIARIIINSMYNYNPKILHLIVDHHQHINYYYFYSYETLEVIDDCEWAISPNNHNQKMKKHLKPKQWWKFHHIKKVKEIRKQVATVFQFPEYQLFKDQIIKDVMFGPLNLGIKKPEAQEYAQKYLTMLNIPESFYNRSPFGLSGGQKRRVAIAGILSIQSDVIIFDEPTAGLDPAGENEMLNIICDLKNNEGKTIIVISHNMDHVLQVADQVLVLNKGILVATGSPYEIFLDEEKIYQWGLEVPYVIKTYHAILKQIENKENKKILQTMMNETKPHDIIEFADLLNQYFAKINSKR